MSRVTSGNAPKVLFGYAVALGVLLLLLCCAIQFGPDKHEVTKRARTEWSTRFREVGLDDVPRHAKYWSGAWVDGIHGNWNFRAGTTAVRRWVSESQSLRTAKCRTKPGRKAYLFYAPGAHRACLVMVFFAPATHPPLGDGEAIVQVRTVEVGVRRSCSSGGMQEVRSAEEAFEHLAHHLDSNRMWARE